MTAPTPDAVSELLGWRPERGLISLYIDADPADRRESWRIALGNDLSAIAHGAEEDSDREKKLAVRATAERIKENMLAESHKEARGFAGFVEAAREPADERWYESQLPPQRTAALYGSIAHVHPLIEALDDGAPRGVVVVSSERVRLFHWQLGAIDELHDWELEIFSRDWRERKAPQSRDPARGEAVSAAGKDQYNERLEANRERFLQQTGSLAVKEAKEPRWHELLIFGDERYAREFEQGFGTAAEPRHVDSADLVSTPIAEIEKRVEELLPKLNREREQNLIERIRDAALSGSRGALGVQETVQALAEGRVEHLVYDAEREYEDVGFDYGAAAGATDLPLVERMIELALATSAAVTPVEAESAEKLAEHEGVGALLRY